MKCEILLEESKTIITKSNLPDTDYVINPYIGCQFGCVYCYASFMGRFVGKNINEWGKYVVVKSNAANLINKEISKLKRTSPNSKILLSSVTDPYQALEVKYKLTRKILKAIAEIHYPGMINILTKSPLVLRDAEILKDIPQIEVGLTVTTINDKLSKTLEVYAPKVTNRLKALRELNEMGLKTYAFIGPLMPHTILQKNLLEDLFYSIKSIGTDSIYIEYLNAKKYIRDRMITLIRDNSELLEVYSKKNYNGYEREIQNVVMELVDKYNFKLKLNEIITHKKN